ncbi:hypothetical protein [Nocardioides albus]|uniref:Uncharacterized protein n=1 Tax=Nocardioides albus TaxID=1841 RepID=A0A7W5F7S5_9ACTN|nr:hypothetical protein [Nocardioides albus]MBB3088433.1 hypothetical protein [Nocardioides albus]GGU16284.1 hypothetical protein GCM10007979_13210 [Nocardioides albus]
MSDTKTSSGPGMVKTVRSYASRVVWVIALIAALALAIGALLIALDANQSNTLVAFVLDAADVADLGLFSRENGIKQFGGEDAVTKNALFNWGIGALAWLIVGRIVAGFIRP